MSILSILTRKGPTIAGYQFDAVLEDSFEATVELTRYPVESGVKVADHRVIQPVSYYLVGAISNNPLKVIDLAGLSAGFLAGSQYTRASSALQFLLDLLVAGMPFDVDAVDIQLKDMVLTKVSRDRDPENEGGLIFVAEMQELIQLDRLADKTQPSQDQLPDDDPAKAGAAATANSGQQIGQTPSVATASNVNMVDGITETPL